MKTLLICASPKKKFCASRYFLSCVRLGLKGEKNVLPLRHKGDHQPLLDALKDADAVVFSMPLYVDAVPSHVLAFLEAMEAFVRQRQLAPRIYVISNSGFIEGVHSEALQSIMANFCARAGLPFGGAVGIGGGIMLNICRLVFCIQLALFLVTLLVNGISAGAWLDPELWGTLSSVCLQMAFFSCGMFFFLGRMSLAARKGRACGCHFTRMMLPATLFILIANAFFFLGALFNGGLFRGWLKKKP